MSSDSDKTISHGLEQTEQIDQVLRAIRLLPETYREVLLLQYGQNLSYRQIADILDVPVTTVQIRLVRARRMILDRISRYEKQRVES